MKDKNIHKIATLIRKYQLNIHLVSEIIRIGKESIQQILHKISINVIRNCVINGGLFTKYKRLFCNVHSIDCMLSYLNLSFLQRKITTE